MRTSSILGWMLLAIALVTALAYWDEERESKAALDDFAQEQTLIASSIASGLGGTVINGDARADGAERFVAVARTIEREGSIRVLLGSATSSLLMDVSGHEFSFPPLTDALRAHVPSVRLSRSEAAELGLPARMALAGIRPVEGGSQSVIVAATARLERDREQRARWRLVLGVVVATGLVLAFGGLAMRKQRTELELAHQLAMSAVRTERDQRLVRADKLATMGAIATGIAHEVSTPLGVILGRAEQLLAKQPDERSRRAVETIAAQTERINAVIRGFLSLARGKQPALEHCAPARLVEAATELVEHRFEKANVRLESEFPGELPNVACDPRLFEQVLVNLLLNACDACEAGGTVSIAVRAEQGRVAFVVTDDGIGISAEDAERAAEPFFTTKPDGKGTGLGLAIANEIVKHHVGSLSLTPGLGGAPGHQRTGTVATVELPAAAVAVGEGHG